MQGRCGLEEAVQSQVDAALALVRVGIGKARVPGKSAVLTGGFLQVQDQYWYPSPPHSTVLTLGGMGPERSTTSTSSLASSSITTSGERFLGILEALGGEATGPDFLLPPMKK